MVQNFFPAEDQKTNISCLVVCFLTIQLDFLPSFITKQRKLKSKPTTINKPTTIITTKLSNNLLNSGKQNFVGTRKNTELISCFWCLDSLFLHLYHTRSKRPFSGGLMLSHLWHLGMVWSCICYKFPILFYLNPSLKLLYNDIFH